MASDLSHCLWLAKRASSIRRQIAGQSLRMFAQTYMNEYCRHRFCGFHEIIFA